CLDAYAGKPALWPPDPNVGFVDPGFPRKPRVLGTANRAAGAREKHRAPPEALTISLDAGGNSVTGLRTLDHDHTHVALLGNFLCLLQKCTGRLEYAFCRCGLLGASHTWSDRASGSGARA